MTTTKEKAIDAMRAAESLENYREAVTAGGLVIINQEPGSGTRDYYRVAVAYSEGGRTGFSHLTWNLARFAGYRLVDRRGQWFIAIDGGNFSKAQELADTLARVYGVDRIRFELL